VTTADDLLAEARRRLVRLDPAGLEDAMAAGALVVDIRPAEQRREQGELPGAVVVERTVFEWRLDPASPHRIPEVRGHDQQVVVVCSEGYSSSLAAAVLQQLGFTEATDLDGGTTGWLASGRPLSRRG
jgi:rhodanese-related sulfurtransferase